MKEQPQNNPYPEDIFTPISKEEWKKINEVLKRELGVPLDRVSGNIGRKLYEGFMVKVNELLSDIEKRIKEIEEWHSAKSSGVSFFGIKDGFEYLNALRWVRDLIKERFGLSDELEKGGRNL
ncbi:MAG TPA: hypothetical protein ENG45_00515 [Candidatus Aenigmarchaeota archaeon]|nr:hypothetical protein [Candidatus Aenigmarchaeota archaeon]